MFKRFAHAFLALGLLATPLLLGCSFVSQTSATESNNTGGTWYVRTGLYGQIKGIYYCPSATPGQCIEADRR